ncbi:MAG: sigma-70 family RNA polymerase sigma factor [Flavobacteriales bacterium]|nr:sigma-70 family RNA polymerase sigma factor [Flavobacteriales bacterium]
MIATNYHQTQAQIRGDAEMIAAAKNDPAQFRGLYDKYYASILNFVYLRLDQVDDAYDVAQQVFLNALSNIGKYEHRGLPFSSWLFRIAVNELNSHYRSRNKYRTVNIDDTQLPTLLREMDNSDREEDKARLLECMKRLSSADYLLLEMRFFEERPFKEIAEILDITENNAKVKTYRAIDRIKQIF